MLILNYHLNKLTKTKYYQTGRWRNFHLQHLFLLRCVIWECIKAVVALSAPSSREEEEEEEEGQRHVARSCQVRPSARAHQRRRGREHGAALILWHPNVADAALTAGRAHLRSTELWLRPERFAFTIWCYLCECHLVSATFTWEATPTCCPPSPV